jgi:hypothetical protein
MSIYTTHGTQDPLCAGDSLASAAKFHVDATERERSRVRMNPSTEPARTQKVQPAAKPLELRGESSA